MKSFRVRIVVTNKLINEMNSIISSKDVTSRVNKVLQENNLQVLLSECLDAKVENNHQREILALEKEFEEAKS